MSSYRSDDGDGEGGGGQPGGRSGERPGDGFGGTSGEGPGGDKAGDGVGDDPEVLEAAAAEAAAWVAACQEAAARGDPDHDVGAGPIGDPALARVVELLTVGVDALLELDAAGRDGSDLLEMVVAVHRLTGQLAAGAGEVMLAYGTSGEWRLKAASAPARVAHRTRSPIGEARAALRMGQNLLLMPETAEAAATGEIGASHVKRLGRLASNERTHEAFLRDEADLVEAARTLTWPMFNRQLAEWLLENDPDGAEQTAAVDEEKRRVHLSDGLDGTGLLDGQLTPACNATVKGALEHFTDELFQEDWDNARDELGREPTVADLARTPAQRRHDALERMAEQAMARLDGTRPAPLVSFVTDFETLSGRIGLLEQTGTVVPPGMLARLITDREVLLEQAIWDAKTQRVGLSNRRLFTGKLRRKIQLRDQSCAWPGCDEPAVNCEIDHVQEWSEGGETVEHNGQPLCKRHNQLKERIRKLQQRQEHRRPQPTEYSTPGPTDPEPGLPPASAPDPPG